MPGPLVGAEHFKQRLRRIPPPTAAAGARRCRTCSGTGSRPGPRCTRSTSSPASATTRSRAPRAASSRCRRRTSRSSRRAARRACSTSWPTGGAEARAAARPDDADLGRVLLRAGVRRAVPARRARPHRRQRRTTSSPRSSAAACGTWTGATALTRYLRRRLERGRRAARAARAAVDRGAGALPAGRLLQHRRRADVRGDGPPAAGRSRSTRTCRRGWPPTRTTTAYLDHVIDETLRLYPLFGIAHRITSADIAVDERTTHPAGSVLCFNYPEFHRTGFDRRRSASTPTAGSTLSRRATRTTSRSASRPTGPARRSGLAPITMRAVAREVLRRFALHSSAVAHALDPEPRALPARPARRRPRAAPAAHGCCVDARPRPLGGRLAQPRPARPRHLHGVGRAPPAAVRAPFRGCGSRRSDLQPLGLEEDPLHDLAGDRRPGAAHTGDPVALGLAGARGELAAAVLVANVETDIVPRRRPRRSRDSPACLFARPGYRDVCRRRRRRGSVCGVQMRASPPRPTRLPPRDEMRASAGRDPPPRRSRIHGERQRRCRCPIDASEWRMSAAEERGHDRRRHRRPEPGPVWPRVQFGVQTERTERTQRVQQHRRAPSCVALSSSAPAGGRAVAGSNPVSPI